MPNPLVEYLTPFIGGLLVLAAWIGWGWALHRLLRLRTPIDWALASTWGIAAVLALAGPLLLLHAANAATLAIITALGDLLFLAEIILRLPRRRSPALHPRPRTWVWHVPMILLLAIAYAGSIHWPGINPPDDLAAYFVFIKRILQTGTLIEPMSFRRLSTYGGHHLLQAMTVLFGDLRCASIVDIGLAPILLIGNLYFMLRRKSTFHWMIVLTATFIVLLIPVFRINSQSAASGLILFLALFRTLRFDRPGGPILRLALVEGLLAAAITTMRINYIAAAGSLFFLLALGRWFAGRPHRTALLRRCIVGLAAFFLALLPWALLLYISSNTLLFPLFRGNANPHYAILSTPLTLPQKCAWLWLTVRQPAFLILVAPLFLLCRRRFLGSLLPLYVAILLASALTIVSFPTSDPINLYRYCVPMLLAGAFAACALALRRPPRSLWFILSGAILATLMAFNFNFAWHYYNALQQSAWDALLKPQPFAVPQTHAAYADAQSAIPRGQALFAATGNPALFNYARNPIFNADMPGAASLPPDMPLAQGPQAVADYLVAHRIHYLILDDFDTDPFLYHRPFWVAVMKHPELNPPTFNVAAPFALQFIHDMSALETPDRIIGRFGDLTILHLP